MVCVTSLRGFLVVIVLGVLVLILLLSVMLTVTLNTAEGENKAKLTIFGKIYREIAGAENGKRSQVWSPFGLEMMLAILNVGARSDEVMLRDIKNKFESVSSSSGANSVKINIVTGGFTEEEPGNIMQTYGKQMWDVFKGDIEQINLQCFPDAATKINAWAKKYTGGRVEKLLNLSDFASLRDGSKGISIVLANVLYFEAELEKSFILTSTNRGSPFYTDGSKKNHVLTHFLSAKGDFYYGDNRELRAEVAIIPFENRKFSMIAVLPHKAGNLASIEEKIVKGFQLLPLTSQLEKKEMVIHFPEIRMETTINFRGILESVGIRGDFLSRQADKILSHRYVVSALFQKTIFRVQGRNNFRLYPFLRATAGMRFDRPFIAYIRDESTNNTLMMYRKVN